MNFVFVLVFSIRLIRIQTENINLNPGDEYKYSFFTGDTLTLQCPVNSSLKRKVRWSYRDGRNESILISIGKSLNGDHKEDSRFSVDSTNQLNNVPYLRINNITSKEQMIYNCNYAKGINITVFNHEYSIRLANITKSLTRNPNGTICCELHGQNISAIKFIWEQQTLYGEHIRLIESVKKDHSVLSKRNANMDMRKHYISCLHLGIDRISTYDKEGEYICFAQIFIHGRSQAVNKTASIKIKNISGRPFCIQDTRSQHSYLGTNITIAINFYSKPNYSAVYLTKNGSELNLGDDVVKMKNISLDTSNNVTVMVSGYETIINITEFTEEDVGNYTVNISNGFGSCNCTVQLLIKENDYPEKNHTKKVVIGNKTLAEITKSLQWYILACGSIIVVLFAISALRSTFLKTVDICSKPTIWKPCCHKSTEKKATKKQVAKKPRRAYSDQFMDVTLNQLNNGERILIIGQTNEMDASTETNI